MHAMTMLRRVVVQTGLACVAAVCLVRSVSGVGVAAPQQKALALYFASPESGGFAGGDAALRKVLVDGLGDHLEYTAEYLDLIRSADSRSQSMMRDYLKARYAGDQFDAIIATSPAVLQFVEADPSLFRDTPASKEELAVAHKKMLEALQPFEAAFVGPYIAGELSIADFTMFPFVRMLARIEARKPGHGIADDRLPPKLRAWKGAIEKLPYYEKTTPPHWKK